MRKSIGWKMASAYFILLAAILTLTNLFVLNTLENIYLQERRSAYLANANIIAAGGPELLSGPAWQGFARAREFSEQMTARVLILNLEGRVMIDSYAESWLLDSIIKHKEVEQALAGTAASGVHHLRNGERVLYVAVPVLKDKVVLGAVLMVVDVDDIYAALGQVRRQMGLVSLGSGMLAALFSLFLAGLFTRPVKELTGAVARMTRGQLQQEVPVRSQDELGRLARAFNEMSASLARVDASRRRFLADASHELKSPLSSIKALAQSLLESDEDDPAVYREFLSDIDIEIDRLNRLLNNMLQLTRLEEDTLTWPRELQQVDRVIMHVAALEQVKAKAAGITLVTDCATGLQWPLNRDLLTCALLNLLDNALRHTSAGGRVTISGRLEADTLVLEVKDTGEGIVPAELEHIFDRFYRVDKARARASGGTGLGLAIAREAVQRQGGTVEVNSQPGQGTVFTMRFKM